MCIGTSRRALETPARRPPIDAAHLLSHVDMKNQYIQSGQYHPQLPTPGPMLHSVSMPESSEEQKQKAAHITVHHDYHDHSHDPRTNYQVEHPARGGVTTPFPLKLHEMLENVSADGFDHIVSWQPHGRCFVVHKPKEFVDLLPQYFKLSKLASFQRQLNLYGFQRMTRGRDRGGYYHELFLRGKVFLAHSIQRIKVKGTGVRARSNPDQEPEFWGMPWVTDDEESSPAPRAALPMVASSHQDTIAPPMPLAMHQLPMYKQEDDIVCAFGNKTFHYLDPFQPGAAPAAQRSNWLGVDELLSNEAESFFHDFDFPDNIGAEIEDDSVFGDMLEQMIA